MAVSLGLSITEVAQDTTIKATEVSVTLTVYWTQGSYNGNSPKGTLYVDGTPYPFTCNFNYAGVGQGNISTSGSTVAISVSQTIYHDSDGTKSITCSATFATGVSSGTVTAQESKTLTPITSSSGGGGSSGGSGESETPHTVTISAGSHTTVRAMYDTTDVQISSGSKVSDGFPLRVFFYADDGYEINLHTINGTTIGFGELYYVEGDITIIVTAVESTGVPNFKSAVSMISACTNLSLLKRRKLNGTKSSANYSITTEMAVQYSWSYNGNTGVETTDGVAYAIKFTTPSASGLNFLKFDFTIGSTDYIWNSDKYLYYAVTSSTANLYNYCDGESSVSDSYVVKSGSMAIRSWKKGASGSLQISDISLSPNTTYYLVFYSWMYGQTGPVYFTYSNLVAGYPGGLCYMNSVENGIEAFNAYIDNGSSFNVYVPYIEDGTKWTFCK